MGLACDAASAGAADTWAWQKARCTAPFIQARRSSPREYTCVAPHVHAAGGSDTTWMQKRAHAPPAQSLPTERWVAAAAAAARTSGVCAGASTPALAMAAGSLSADDSASAARRAASSAGGEGATTTTQSRVGARGGAEVVRAEGTAQRQPNESSVSGRSAGMVCGHTQVPKQMQNPTHTTRPGGTRVNAAVACCSGAAGVQGGIPSVSLPHLPHERVLVDAVGQLCRLTRLGYENLRRQHHRRSATPHDWCAPRAPSMRTPCR